MIEKYIEEIRGDCWDCENSSRGKGNVEIVINPMVNLCNNNEEVPLSSGNIP